MGKTYEIRNPNKKNNRRDKGNRFQDNHEIEYALDRSYSQMKRGSQREESREQQTF